MKEMQDPTKEEMLGFLEPYSCDGVDTEAAIYWFASDYHSGQWSNLYSALSTSPYRPGRTENSVEGNETAHFLYRELKDRYSTL